MPPLNGNLSSISLEYIEGLREDFLRDPAAVSPEWQRYFAESDELNGAIRCLRPSFLPRSLFHRASINPPQSGVLGLHAIQDRPVARKGEVVIRPMMYVALTYDHRIVDGREAVGFLGRIKDMVEQPSRILLEV